MAFADLDVTSEEFGLSRYELKLLHGFTLSVKVRQIPTFDNINIECECDTLIIKEFSKRNKIDFLWFFSLCKELAEKKRVKLQKLIKKD